MDLAKLFRGCSFGFSLIAERIEFRKCNPEIFRHRDCFETVRALAKFIRPKRVCDIGAHKGSWSTVLKHMVPEMEHLVLFEPQAEYIALLEQLTLPGVKKVVYGCGLGEKESTMAIKGGTASASFLEAAPAQTGYFPGSVNREKAEDVIVKRLDRIYADDRLPYPEVIKIDVQGWELDVLRGGVQVLSRAKYLVIEMSFAELYQGQPPLSEILSFLEKLGYRMVGRGYEWRSPQFPYELLQMDGIFFNMKADVGTGE